MSTETTHFFAERPRDQRVLSIRASLPERDADGFIADALRDVRAYIREHQLQPAGPPFSIRRPRDGVIDVEAGWPIAKAFPGAGRIHGGALPRSLLQPETGRSVR